MTSLVIWQSWSGTLATKEPNRWLIICNLIAKAPLEEYAATHEYCKISGAKQLVESYLGRVGMEDYQTILSFIICQQITWQIEHADKWHNGVLD